MDWIYYVLLGVLPAVAAFAGGVVLTLVTVIREHVEDLMLIQRLAERLADEKDPLTPEEFRALVQEITDELGETKKAWEVLWRRIKELAKR